MMKINKKKLFAGAASLLVWAVVSVGTTIYGPFAAGGLVLMWLALAVEE